MTLDIIELFTEEERERAAAFAALSPLQKRAVNEVKVRAEMWTAAEKRRKLAWRVLAAAPDDSGDDAYQQLKAEVQLAGVVLLTAAANAMACGVPASIVTRIQEAA